MRVVVIVVVYNGQNWLPICLKSIKDNNFPVEVILVDNASKDNSVSFIKTNYPEYELLCLETNCGFGAANNLAIKKAFENNADYVFLLNQDAWILPDTLATLINIARLYPEYGILSPIHLDESGNSLDFKFSEYLRFQNDNLLINDILIKSSLTHVYELSFVNAAAWLISKQCLSHVGYFDSLFFHYGEDANFCQRVIYHKFKIGIVPNSFVHHGRKQFRVIRSYSLDKISDLEEYKREFFVIFGNVLFKKSKHNIYFRREVLRLFRNLFNSLFKFRFREIVFIFKKIIFALSSFSIAQKSCANNRLSNHI